MNLPDGAFAPGTGKAHGELKGSYNPRSAIWEGNPRKVRRSPVVRKLQIGAAILALASGLVWAAEEAALKVGDRAPDFTLPDQNGNAVKLSNYLGKKNVVLAFYVLAFTGG